MFLLVACLMNLASVDKLPTVPPAASGTADGPNIIYILADDLGWSEVGCYGQEKIQTPHIDRVAAEGMRFTQHYSGSTVCAPSRCVLLTGKHTGQAVVRNNWENGGWGKHEPEGQYPLPDAERTLGELLQEQGYATACIGKWGLGGPDTVGHPNRQGFDFFFGYLCQRKAHNYYPSHLWRNDEKQALNDGEFFSAHQRLEDPLENEQSYRARYDRRDYAPDLLRDEAVEFIRTHATEPFFLYYASPIPHVALQAPWVEIEAYPESWDPKPYLGTRGYLPHPRPRAAYAAMISRLDAEIGAILAEVERQGLTDRTLVIISSDNGTTYAGGVDYDFFDSCGPLRGLKGSLYEGGIRVPMVVRWPTVVAPGSTSHHISGFHDVMPTLAAITGGTPGPTTGTSFLPTLTGGAQDSGGPLYWECGTRQAVRDGRWKAVRNGLKQGSLALELYDLDQDPGETTDLAATQPAVAARMHELLHNLREPSEVFPLPTVDDLSSAGELTPP